MIYLNYFKWQSRNEKPYLVLPFPVPTDEISMDAAWNKKSFGLSPLFTLGVSDCQTKHLVGTHELPFARIKR